MKLSNLPLPTSKLTSLAISLLVFIARLGILPANISPLGSFGFFSQSFFLYFAIIITFDYFVGGFYPDFWFVYLGFLAYPLLGRLAHNHPKRQLLFLPLASFLFFLISNFGVWYYWYPHTLSGLLTCYTLALPFYTRTLTGDLIFSYGYLILKYLLPRLTFTRVTIHPTI